MSKRRIVDGFLFYNELDMLEYRLLTLDPVVDVFVLVESAYTFAGKPKPFYYEEAVKEGRFAAYKDKIVHVKLPEVPHIYPNIDYKKEEQWNNEGYQRNAIALGIEQLELSDKDLVIISDVDEIPDPETLRGLKTGESCFLSFDVASLEMDLYYYDLTCRHINKWYYPKVLRYGYYKTIVDTTPCHQIRFSNSRFPAIPKGGWHLAYFGDVAFIQNKIANFAHQEFNQPPFTNEAAIRERMAKKADLFDRAENPFDHVVLSENDYLPPGFI